MAAIGGWSLVSALSLRLQLETSNIFLEIVTILQGDELECPDQPRRLLLCIARGPGVRLRDIAAGPGSTERSAYGTVTDLTEPATRASRKTAAATATRGCGRRRRGGPGG